jgi:competence protein ComEA
MLKNEHFEAAMEVVWDVLLAIHEVQRRWSCTIPDRGPPLSIEPFERRTTMTRRLLPLMVIVTVVAAVVFAGDTGSASEGVVNVNSATAAQLQFLPGIGPAMAKRIIEFRDSNGPFRKVDELVAIRGIGSKTLEKLRPFVVTEGKTTLAVKVRSGKRAASNTNN